jgi:outer membrane protein TolC
VLTLEEAIRRALSANRGLADSSDAISTADLSIAAARAEFELKLIPSGQAGLSGSSASETTENVGLGLELRRRFVYGTQTSLQPFTRKEGDAFRTGANASIEQPLLRGLNREANLASVHDAEFSARTARRAHYLKQVSTVLGVVSAVYEVVRQRELVNLTEASVKRLQGHQRAAEAREKLGLASAMDVYRASIQLKQAEDGLAVARESLDEARDNLALLLALPVENPPDVQAPLTYDQVRTEEKDAIRVAVETRAEMDQAEDNVREARRRSRVAKHNTLPDLNLKLSAGRFGESPNYGKSAAFDEDTWSVGLSSTSDLFRTAEHAAHEQSVIAVRSAHRNLDLQREEVQQQVKREVRSLRRAEKRIGIQQEQLRQARAKLELARVKFQRGLAGNFDVVEAEAETRSAETSLLSAVIDYIGGTYRLRSAMGTLIEKPMRF